MLVHHRVTPTIKFAGMLIGITWVNIENIINEAKFMSSIFIHVMSRDTRSEPGSPSMVNLVGERHCTYLSEILILLLIIYQYY